MTKIFFSYHINLVITDTFSITTIHIIFFNSNHFFLHLKFTYLSHTIFGIKDISYILLSCDKQIKSL